MKVRSAVDTVQAQLDAYNARDLEAWLATYADDAVQCDMQGQLLATGHSAIRERARGRFAEPNLHAQLLQRSVMRLNVQGDSAIVVDHERVTRNFPEGLGSVEMMCVYEVRAGLIQRASFALGSLELAARQQNG